MTESRQTGARLSTIIVGVALTVLVSVGLIALLQAANRGRPEAKCRRSRSRTPVDDEAVD